jgi:hypothetical protein
MAERGQILWYMRGRARARLREAAIMPLNNWGRIRRTVLRRLLSIAAQRIREAGLTVHSLVTQPLAPCRTASTRTALTASQPPVRGIQSLSRTVIRSTWVCGGSDGSSDVTISRSLPAVLCADVGCPPSRVHRVGASAKSLK